MDNRNPSVLVVIPAYNGEEIMEQNVKALRDFLLKSMKNWKILIAENGSSDQTYQEALKLSEKYPEVACTHRDEGGRGGALREAWINGDAEILAYMDMDLSTDLGSFPQLIDTITQGYDIATGSRNVLESRARRDMERRILSRSYNILLRLMFGTSLLDTQCGFKAIRKEVAMEILPKVRDNHWFFDTELLILAEKKGFKVKEIPVTWTEGSYTQLKLLDIASNLLKSTSRLWWNLHKI